MLHRVRPPEKNKVRFDGQLISAYTLDLGKVAIWGFRTVPYVGVDCKRMQPAVCTSHKPRT